MLRIFSNGRTANCEGASRREFLQIGTCGIGGLTLPALLSAKANAGSGNPVVRDKAVVVLNLQGGPTHIETFDPKMTAPREYRAMFGEVQTNVPGVTFGKHFERLATLADRMAVVRSFRHGNGSHASAAQLVMAGGNPTGANMGTIYSRVAGMTNPRTGIPSCSVLVPGAAGDAYKKLGAQTSRVTSVGTLPKSYAPFDPSAGSDILKNMELKLDEKRLDDRRALLGGLNRLRRNAEQSEVLDGLDRFQTQAFDVITGGIRDAFDLSKENPELLARYDTAAFKIPKWLQKKKSNVPAQSPIALGKQMLLARRLVEAGCGFVTVTSAGWDMHGNAFGIDDGMPLLGSAVDKAASAFLEDVEARGLSEKILLVITGEFGRTPRINKKGGRDHWGNLCTLALAGGGLNMGQVVGRSDRTASTPATEPVTTNHLLGTVMGTLFDLAELRLQSGVPTEIARSLNSSTTIPNLG